MVLAEFAHAYSLYSNSVPVLNPYSFYGKEEEYDRLIDSMLSDGTGKYLMLKVMPNDWDLIYMNQGDKYTRYADHDLVLEKKIPLKFYHIYLIRKQ